MDNPLVRTHEEWEGEFWARMAEVDRVPAVYTGGLNHSLFRDSDSDFNLNKLKCLAKNGKIVEGIQTPFTYFGSANTIFPWHTEDYNLYSLRYLHCGVPKICYR